MAGRVVAAAEPERGVVGAVQDAIVVAVPGCDKRVHETVNMDISVVTYTQCPLQGIRLDTFSFVLWISLFR